MKVDGFTGSKETVEVDGFTESKETVEVDGFTGSKETVEVDGFPGSKETVELIDDTVEFHSSAASAYKYCLIVQGIIKQQTTANNCN